MIASHYHLTLALSLAFSHLHCVCVRNVIHHQSFVMIIMIGSLVYRIDAIRMIFLSQIEEKTNGNEKVMKM